MKNVQRSWIPLRGKKLWTSFLILLLFFFIFRNSVLAELFINEFVSDTPGSIVDSDWVEIYNSGLSPVDLLDYRLEDFEGTNKKVLTGIIDPSGFAAFDWSNKLNKTGDVISLIKISDSSLIDKVGYGNKGNDVNAPAKGQSAGRDTDGKGGWILFSTPSKYSTNNTSLPVPTPTQTLTPSPTNTPTPTRTPTPTKTPIPTKTPTQSPIKSDTIVKTNSIAAPTNVPIQIFAQQTAEDESEVLPTSILGESTESAVYNLSPTRILEIKTSPSAIETKALESKGNILSKILLAAGIIFLLSCGILVFRSYKKNKKDTEEI